MTSRKSTSGSTVPPRPTRRPASDGRRETVEVQLEWLEEDPKTKSKKGPPPIPNARVRPPPMPVVPSKPPPAPRACKPPKRHTMEVDVRELVIVPELPLKGLLKPTRPAGKPIPREEPDAEPSERKKPERR